MWGRTGGLTAAAFALAASTLDAQAPASLADVCTALDAAPTAVAARAATLSPAERDRAVTLARSDAVPDARCGIAVLAALRDPRAAPALVAAVERPALRDDAYWLARWAAFVAGGPDPTLGNALLPLVAALATPALRSAAGDDGIRLLGEIDRPEARERLHGRLAETSDGEVDAAIHALARQGDASVRARVTALGREVAGTLSTNPTYEQARRIGAVAFYQLALGSDSLADGLATLRYLPARDQADAAAWAVQTVCERAVRHPGERAALDAHRAGLVAALEPLALPWRTLTRGAFACPAP